MIAIGVPAGASSPSDAVTTKPGRPASAAVGISGGTGEALGARHCEDAHLAGSMKVEHLSGTAGTAAMAFE